MADGLNGALDVYDYPTQSLHTFENVELHLFASCHHHFAMFISHKVTRSDGDIIKKHKLVLFICEPSSASSSAAVERMKPSTSALIPLPDAYEVRHYFYFYLVYNKLTKCRMQSVSLSGSSAGFPAQTHSSIPRSSSKPSKSFPSQEWTSAAL